MGEVIGDRDQMRDGERPKTAKGGVAEEMRGGGGR